MRMAAKASVRRLAGERSGQGSVELMAVFPTVIILAVVLTNALLFFSDCAAFDRLARNAIRTHICVPGYGEDVAVSLASVQQALEESFDRDNLTCRATLATEGSFVRVKATMGFTPTLFGLGLKRSVFGVRLPELTHEVSLCVYRYKPGVIL